MSHNPNTVKSQDDINEGGRKSDVLIATIDKVIELEDWKMDMQAKYGSKSAELERTKKQLEIAVAGLQYYANEDIYIEGHKVVNGKNEWTSEVMLDNGVKASYFLKKIKEISK